MAEPLVILILRDPAYQADDRVILRVDGVEQPDRVQVWDATRRTMGEGYGNEQSTGEGFGQWVRYGEGIEGHGWDGQGAGVLRHRTLRSFVAGDYGVTGQGVDLIGNDGTVSAVLHVAHRPAPPAVQNLRVSSNGVITFTWSDP